MLWQAALDHAWLARMGLLAASELARRDTGVETRSPASSSLLGAVPRGPAGSLAPAQLLQLSVTMRTLTRYPQTQVLSLHLISLLGPEVASYLSENESWISPLHDCHHVLRVRIAAVCEKAAVRLAQPANSHQTSLFPCSPNLSI